MVHLDDSIADICFSDAWPSSAAFDLIRDALKDDAERKDAIKKGGAIFAFTLKNDQGETADWYVDLKETGTVGKGTAPEGKKANGKRDPTPLQWRTPQRSEAREDVGGYYTQP